MGMILFLTTMVLAFQLEPPSAQVTAEQFAGMNRFMREAVLLRLNAVEPAEYSQDVLEIIKLGLQDDTAKVQQYTHTVLWKLAFVRSGAKQSGQTPPSLDPSVDPALKEILWSHLESSDSTVRQMAMNNLVLISADQGATAGEGFDPKLEGWMLDRYHNEDPKMRRQIIARLREFDLQSTRARRLIVEALRDPANDVRQQAVLGVGEFKPPDALPQLLAVLRADPTDAAAFLRRSVAAAIGNYGNAAESYVPQLRQIAAAEQDPGVKTELERAISKIETAKNKPR